MTAEPSCEKKESFQGRVFTVEEHLVLLEDGSKSRREIVRHTGGACVLALTADLQVAMVRQYRKAIEEFLWEIPAGKLEPGEDPQACARRELAEETGYLARDFRLLTVLYPTPGYCSEKLHIYLATGLVAGQARPDPGEFLTCRTQPLSELLDLAEKGLIRDAKTLTALLLTDRLLQKEPALAQKAEEM